MIGAGSQGPGDESSQGREICGGRRSRHDHITCRVRRNPSAGVNAVSTQVGRELERVAGTARGCTRRELGNEDVGGSPERSLKWQSGSGRQRKIRG